MSSSSSRSRTRMSRSTQSLKDRVINIEKLDFADAVTFLAKCLFYSIHFSNASNITVSNTRLGEGVHRKLEYNMYDSAEKLKTHGFSYLKSCHELFCSHNSEYMKLDSFIEMILNQYADPRLLKKMKRENYSSLFCSILHKAGTNYVSELKLVSPTLYAYDNIDVYGDYCTKFMHSRLVSAIETSVHMLLDDGSRMVSLELYEIVKKDRDKLFLKYRKLSKKYRKLKSELED